MSRRLKPLDVLEGDQRRAADPGAHASLSASAGTGKTHVLTARVFLLLLRGVRPETILCLTFTKAGAAEMANRIGERLAAWVRMPDADLRKELFALGEDNSPPMLDHARRLFARVLEAPGGLRIQTIHAFAQTLLAAFPAEAGITPGFRPIEGRAEQELARRTLADLVAEAERGGDGRLIADIQALSMRLGEEGAVSYLADCAKRADAFAGLGPREAIEPRLRELVGLPADDVADFLHNACADDNFDCALLRSIAAANIGWGTVTGRGHAQAIDEWLGLDPAGRFANLHAVAKVVMKADGEPRAVGAGQLKAHPDYQQMSDDAHGMIAWLAGDEKRRRADRRAGRRASGGAGLRRRLQQGQASGRCGRLRRPHRAGHARLLETPGMGDWVRFKLDRRTDHILVDEAQDTNADQWAIVKALAEEYFTGASETDRRWRTLFMVGDFKQAIFRFQGTDPREFEAMRRFTRDAAASLEESDEPVREFRELSINASFRSSPAVLDVVDAVIAEVGHEAMGLPERPARHEAFHSARPGRVEWWPAFTVDEGKEEAGEEGWLDESERRYASHLARTVRQWLDEAPVMASTGRPLTAGDVLILVRSRGELASLLVARLFAERVPVAGIDRLHLHRPLAVKDLLAAVGFAVQPLDDLTLANLLVSPLIGWDQDQLYDVARGRGKKPLWPVLLAREGEGGFVDEALGKLRQLLAMADYTTPARFLETILSGPLDGRRRLLARLGPEARDPIEELVSAALEFERDDVNSLDRFLAWFGRGDVEIKRDPAAPVDAVRVMTVHGAKGLEAPVVILADATADPSKLGATNPPLDFPVGGSPVPLIRPRKAERCDPFTLLIEEEDALDLAEHWRLLYVALTRARERLVVAGVARKRAVADSWHARVEQAMIAAGAVREGEAGPLVFEATGETRRSKARVDRRPALVLPDWIKAMAPVESRPPRPLAPSASGEDNVPFPPPAPGEVDAARRGTLLHLLFERLPGVAPDQRRAAAEKWLEVSGGVDDVALRASYAATVCEIIQHTDFRDVFGENALAEAPIAAILPDGRVIAGTVDRLLVEEGRVRVIDFKTGAFVPTSAAEVPRAHLSQMAAYAEALGVIFPGRSVEAALLYTSGPKMIALPG